MVFNKFTSLKTNFERASFPTETENQSIHEIKSPRISKKPTILENKSQQI